MIQARPCRYVGSFPGAALLLVSAHVDRPAWPFSPCVAAARDLPRKFGARLSPNLPMLHLAERLPIAIHHLQVLEVPVQFAGSIEGRSNTGEPDFKILRNFASEEYDWRRESSWH